MATRGKTRQLTPDDPFNGLGGSLLLHATTLALLVGWAIFTRSGRTWGSPSATPSTISATMVSSLPLPPKVIPQTENVLATETPSPAPIQAAPKTVAAPQPDAIPIPAPQAKPARQAARTTPPPPLHPQPTQVKPTQVQSGEAAANIPMSSVQTRAGTVSVNTQDQSFGSRFPWYVQQITQKVAQQWYTNMLDPGAYGHRVYVTFQIARDGSVSRIQIAQRSGDATLDQTALSAVQHIDTFPPLPDAYSGSYLNVTYYFDPPPRQ